MSDSRKRSIEAVVKYPNYDAEVTRRPVKAGRYDRFGFRLSDDGGTIVCPAGRRLRAVRTEETYTKSGFRSDTTHFRCDDCEGCPFTDRCQLQKNKDKTIGRRLGNLREERKAKEILDRPENQVKLKRRSLEPEPVFGQLKYNHGYTRFRHFGKAKVEMDLGFVFMALNIAKLHKNMHKSA